MSMAIKSHCALMPLLHGIAQQTNIQNLKPDAASTVLFSFKEASIFIDLFIRFWRPAESIPQIEKTRSICACDAEHAIRSSARSTSS